MINIAESKFLTNIVMLLTTCRKKQLEILKQDNGRGVVLHDKTKYVEKCFSIVNTSKFKKLYKNPTVSYEAPVLADIFMVELERNLTPILKVFLTTPFVSSKIDRLNMYCQHLIISIVPLNLLMKQKVVTIYPS